MTVKTTVYFPEDLKARIERESRRRGVSEAEVIRTVLDESLPENEAEIPLPRFGLFSGPPDLSERVDEYLEGFGEN